MAAFDEADPFGAPPKKKAAHELGQPLDTLSVDELAERVELLRGEIARLESALAAKLASRAAADSIFKTS